MHIVASSNSVSNTHIHCVAGIYALSLFLASYSFVETFVEMFFTYSSYSTKFKFLWELGIVFNRTFMDSVRIIIYLQHNYRVY